MATTPFKRLGLKDFNDICRAVLGWDSEIRYTFQIHGQEFNSFQRKTRSKRFATPDLVLHSRILAKPDAKMQRPVMHGDQ